MRKKLDPLEYLKVVELLALPISFDLTAPLFGFAGGGEWWFVGRVNGEPVRMPQGLSEDRPARRPGAVGADADDGGND